MPKKRICIILESEEELLDMIRKEQKGRFRDRLRLLWLLKTGKAESMIHAAELCGITYHTAAERLRRYENGGIPELFCLKTAGKREKNLFFILQSVIKKIIKDIRKRGFPGGKRGAGRPEKVLFTI